MPTKTLQHKALGTIGTEARVRDLALAQALGYRRADNIRNLINRRVQVRDLQDAPDLKTFARQVADMLTRMYKTPETFDISEVASQVGKKLDTPRFMSMLGDLGRAREAAKHPLMTYLPVKTLSDDLAKGVAGSNGTVPGAGAANAGVAQSAFLRWQIEYLAANPKTSASGFHDEAMKVYDKLLRQYGNGQTLNMGQGQAYGLKKFAPVAVGGEQQPAPQATPQPARLMTLEQAIQVLRKNPTPQVMRSFDESYPGHKANDYLK